MGKMLDSVASGGVTRRRFVELFAGTAALAGLSLAGCSPSTGGGSSSASSSSARYNELVEVPYADQVAKGKWVTHSCWHNCGGRCLNKSLVVDGVVIRQKTDDTHQDSADYPQQRGCVRGRAERQEILSPDRLKYPMKRKGWNPGDGDKGKELRGKDEWEQITWDEAIPMIGDEIHRIIKTYGNESVFMGGGSEAMALMAELGGYTGHWGTTSRGSYTTTPGLCGWWPQSNEGINDRISLRGADIVVLHGCNPAWASAGNPTYHLLQVAKEGAEVICIDPIYNATAATFGAEWIPIRPSTDIAFLMGLTTTIYQLDQAGEDLIDWDYVNTHMVGFDSDHMPDDAEEGAISYLDHLLGKDDGIVKDAAWASKICGVDEDKFAYLARKLSKHNNVDYLTAWSQARTHNSDNVPQAHMVLGALTGHLGKKSNSWGLCGHSRSCNGGAFMLGAGSSGYKAPSNPLKGASINDTQIWEGMKAGRYISTSSSATPGEERDIDVKMIWWGYTALLQTRDGGMTGIEVLRSKPDFVLSEQFFLTTNAKYSDIVLPATTQWEKPGNFLQGNREDLIMCTKVIDPYYESKDDSEIANLIGEYLANTYPDDFPDLKAPVIDVTESQQFMNKAIGAYYYEPGDYQTKHTLLTISAEQMAEYGIENGTPQTGVITFDEMMEQGHYQIPRSEGDGYDYIAWKDFRDDVNNNAAAKNSASGKHEAYCQVLKDKVNGMGFSKIEAYPTYIAPEDGYDGTFKDNMIGGEKGEYPLQVFNPHYLRRSHSDFDNVAVLREAWPNPVYINSLDAKKYGIKTGDTVQITSPHGTTLRNACVTACIMQGVVGLPHGSWSDINEETGIDEGGWDNALCGGISTGAGVSGWNTCRCNIMKYSGDPLPADTERTDIERRTFF